MEARNEMHGDLPVAGELTVKQTWLHTLLGADLYKVCKLHGGSTDNKKSIYCIDCQVTMCACCYLQFQKFFHKHHKFLQALLVDQKIVLQVHEIEKLIDLSKIQMIMRNHADVVFLKSQNERDSSPAQVKTGQPECRKCSKYIKARNDYCSLACKVSRCRSDIYRFDVSQTSTHFVVGETWLHNLLNADLYSICKIHKESRKKIYCMDCELMMSSCCYLDLQKDHQNHKLLHSRVHNNQVGFQLYEMENLIDCSNIQIYKSYGGNIIFLKPLFEDKPQFARRGRVNCNSQRCIRRIPEGIRYCSLACKVSECSPNELYHSNTTPVLGIRHQSADKGDSGGHTSMPDKAYSDGYTSMPDLPFTKKKKEQEEDNDGYTSMPVLPFTKKEDQEEDYDVYTKRKRA